MPLLTDDTKIRQPAASSSPFSVCVLASGSRGNAILVSNESTSILIDAGLSGIEIQRRLQSRGLKPENLTALLVSHEHTDHIQGIGILARRFNIPVFINPQTHQSASRKIGKIKDIRHFECGTSFQIESLKIHPFSISHDAEDPSGFTIENPQQRKIGIATDLGIATAMVKTHLSNCNVLVLESNHDPDLLENGSYPWPLKQRIKSRVGHLSNRDAKNLLADIRHRALSHVILAHLSEENNTPEHALREVGQALNASATRLTVAHQATSTDILCVT